MDFTASGSGTLEEPSIQLAVRVNNLTLDHEREGNLTLTANSHGEELHLSGDSQFEHADFHLDGDVHLRDQWESNLTLHFNHLDVDPVLRNYLRGHVTGQSSVSGDLRAQGPLRQPRNLQVTGNLGDFHAQVEGINVHNDGPILFSIAQQSLTIEQFRLLGDETNFPGTEPCSWLVNVPWICTRAARLISS